MARKGKGDRRQRGNQVRVGRKGPASARRSTATNRGFRSKTASVRLIVAAITGVAVLGLVVALVSAGSGASSDFEFNIYQGEETLGGSRLNFGDIVGQDKPVVLNFWGGDCPPCRQEIPAFQRIYDQHRDELVFLGLDVGVFTGLGTRQSALELLDELGITYPAGAPRSRTPIKNYSVTSLPTTIFFAANGEVFTRWDGGIGEDRMNAIVSALLEDSQTPH